MGKYRKKPVVIEAFQWLVDKVPEWWVEKSGSFEINLNNGCVYIPTLEGTMTANKGDWIIKGIKGELYPCKPDIFDSTYEPVEQSK